MSWAMAMEAARRRADYTGRKIYVRAYKTVGGYWRYGTYASPTPSIQGREW